MLSDIQDNQARIKEAGGEPLGSILYWEVPGDCLEGRDGKIPLSEFLDLAEECQVPSEYLPKGLTVVDRFGRCVKHLRSCFTAGKLIHTETDLQVEGKVQAELIYPKGDSTSYAVVFTEKLVDEEEQAVSYRDLGTIHFNREEKQFFGSGRNEDQAAFESSLCQEAAEHFESLDESIQQRDVVEVITKAAKETALRLRRSTIWYVPQGYQDIFASMDALVKRIHPSCNVTQIELLSLPLVQENIPEKVEESLEAKAEVMFAELDETLANIRESTRHATLKTRMQSLEQFKEQVGEVSQILSLDMEALQIRIEERRIQIKEAEQRLTQLKQEVKESVGVADATPLTEEQVERVRETVEAHQSAVVVPECGF